jgi:hypothetical protein
MGGPLMLCRWHATESSLRALRKIEQSEDFEDLNNSKNMVFNVKKLFNDGQGMMLW